jgi:hypothetical protein
MLTAVTLSPVFPSVRYSRGEVFSAAAKEGSLGKSGITAVPTRAEDILLRNFLRSVFSKDMMRILLFNEKQVIITFCKGFFNEPEEEIDTVLIILQWNCRKTAI